MIELSFIILFFILGLIFSTGKGSSLLSGYNMMADEEKEKYDLVALCKFLGEMMFAMCLTMLIWMAGDHFNVSWLTVTGIFLFILLIIWLVVNTTGERFKNES